VAPVAQDKKLDCFDFSKNVDAQNDLAFNPGLVSLPSGDGSSLKAWQPEDLAADDTGLNVGIGLIQQ